jgi:ABC-type branched-subunit amino acid transport system permease subunit
MPIETTAAAGTALLKIFGLPVAAGALAAALGFVFMWPKTRKEAFIRFFVTIITSVVLGPVLVIVMRSWWPSLFESAKDIATLYGADPAMGFLFIGAPLMVMAGLPAWWVMGACVRWLDRRRDKDIAELAIEAAATVRDMRSAL